MTRTTRMTSPEPEGVELMFQNWWDEARGKQVRTYMSQYDTHDAFRNFCMAVKKGADEMLKQPNDGKLTICPVYGSYDRNDKWDKDGDLSKQKEAEFDDYMARLGEEPKWMLTHYLKKHGITIVKRGIRQTGCICYTDGTCDPIDPRTGLMLGGEKEVSDIKNIDTCYAMLAFIKDCKTPPPSDMD